MFEKLGKFEIKRLLGHGAMGEVYLGVDPTIGREVAIKTILAAKVFLANLKLLAATTDKAEGLKKVVSAALQGTEKAIEALGGESATIKTLGGQAETNILGESFYSQAPIRYGDYIAKIAVVPVSPKLTALTGAPLHTHGHPNAIRDDTLGRKVTCG